MAASTSTARPGSVQEYIVRIPKGSRKKHSIMKFNVMNKIDISTWNEVKMERENNVAEFKSELDELPKFGAGSVYNSEHKELARKKKHGIAIKNYNPDEQPWHLKVGGKTSKKYRGVREGGILDNASFYVFTEASDGAFEAFPVEEWYNFSPVARYKTLNAEEAEEEFGRRDKVLNYFSIMVKKRLKNEDEEVEGENFKDGNVKSRPDHDFKISEMDDWTDASDNEDSDADSETEKKKPKKKTKKKAPVKEKRKKRGTDDEAEEESDEFDEGQEVDYISDDTSSSEEEAEKSEKRQKDDIKGVEDEEALRVFDISEDEGAEANEDKEDENAEDKFLEKKSKKAATEKGESSSDTSSDSSDSDNIDSDIKSAMFMQKANQSKNGSDKSTSSSRANTPTSQLSTNSKDSKSSPKKVKKVKSGVGVKRKSPDDSSESPNAPAKKIKNDTSNMSGERLNDESIRRYLMRKPITAAELLQKFKSKRHGMSVDQLATTIAAILKRLNPNKQTIKGKIYWSLKE